MRSTGTILALDLVSAEKTTYFHSWRDRLYDHFISRGILLRPLGNTLYCMPPYCITNDELDQVYDALESCAMLIE